MGKLGSPFMSGDELIGDIIEVVADNLWLRADSQEIIAGALDQCRVPARRDGAESVPCVAGDKTELGGLSTKLFLDITISLRRRFMVLYPVGAEPPLEEINNAAALKLSRLNLKQVVGEGEEPKARMAQLA